MHTIGILGSRSREYDNLFRKWDKLLHLMVRKNMSGLRLWFEYDELLNHARLGLWRAHVTFDPTAGANFQTYSRRVILNSFNALRKYSRAGQRRDRIRSFSIDEEVEDGMTYQLSAHAVPADSKMVSDEEARAVNFALGSLTGREHRIVIGRLYEEKTLEAIGAEMGVTRERVRQLEKKALLKLSSGLRPYFRSLAGNASPDLRVSLGHRPK